MAIKGLTDRGMAFPEIGQIRKGAKKTSNRPGKDLDHFRVEFAEGEEEAAIRFAQAYPGPKITEIRIVLPFNEITRMWDPFLEAHTAGRMVARSDGEKYLYLIDTKTGEIVVNNGVPFMAYDPKLPCGKDYKGKPVYCKPTGRLKVFVPELERAAYLTVHTGSWHDIGNLSDQLSAFYNFNNGQIAGIPLVLRRRNKKVSIPGEDGKRMRVTKSLLSIEVDQVWARGKMKEIKHLASPEVIEAEIRELPMMIPDTTGPAPEQPAPSEPDPEETNGGRPYPAEVLKAKLVEAAAKYQVQIDTNAFSPRGRPEKEPEVGQFTLRKNLEECFAANQKETRYAICKYLWGEASSTKLPPGEVIATIRWLNAKPEKSGGDWRVDAMAVPEAHNLYTAALKAEGQLTMELEKTEAEDEHSVEPGSQPE